MAANFENFETCCDITVSNDYIILTSLISPVSWIIPIPPEPGSIIHMINFYFMPLKIHNSFSIRISQMEACLNKHALIKIYLNLHYPGKVPDIKCEFIK